MKTLYYKIKKPFISPDNEKEVPTVDELRKEVKQKYGVSHIKDKDLKNYDVNFTSWDYMAADKVIDAKVEEKLKEIDNTKEYINLNHISYDITKVEIPDGEKEEDIINKVKNLQNLWGG